MRNLDINVLIGGEAGAGVMAAGTILAKALVRCGLYVFTMNEYPSLIRGGHVWYLARICKRKVYSQKYEIDLLIALNKETITKHKTKVKSSGIILADENAAVNLEESGREIIAVPFTDIIYKLGGKKVMRNSVAIGAAAALLNLDFEVLNKVFFRTFRNELAEINSKLAWNGYRYVVENYERRLTTFKLTKQSNENILLTGNDAVALGALKAGMSFFAAYPMTPASPILHLLATVENEYDIIVLQPESEIAAINMVIGAAYAGARAMTATSGGGFSLMTEALGQAAMTETPIVIVVAQRPGPSTGMPTFTGQGDLRFVLHASQGEFPRVVVAPGDVDEAFYLTVEAFNIAELFQVPVIILTDKHLAESQMTTRRFDESLIKINRGELITGEYKGDEPYKRYKITETGISPRAIPGTKNAVVKANSSEHDEYGHGTSEASKVKAMIDKRFRKQRFIKQYVERLIPLKVYGEGDVTLITWGSPKGAALEAIEDLKKDGINARLLQVVFLEPFPVELLRKELKKGRIVILMENNRTGLLNTLLNEHLHVDVKEKLLKYDGRPFYPHEIVKKVKEVLG